jgi:hypothetical protein
MTMSSRMISLAWICFLTMVLAVIPAGCKSPPPQATKLGINLDPCIKKVDVTLTQGATTQTQTSDNPGSPEFTDFDWGKPIAVKIAVVEMKPGCESSIAKGDVYYFNGVVPSPGGAVTLAAADLPNLYRPNDVPKTGKVYGGVCKTKDRGPGIALGVDLSGASGDCTKTCWEQWIKPQLFWLDGTTEREIMNGKSFADPAGGTAHTYGKFDRDQPQGSTMNCYGEDEIPGKPGSTGLVDAPAFRPKTGAEENAFFGQAGVAIKNLSGTSSAPPFTVRFRFTVVSVLWCEAPGPPSIIGNYTWSAYQDYQFVDNTPPQPHFWKSVKGNSIIKNTDIKWNAGTTGLDPSMQAH